MAKGSLSFRVWISSIIVLGAAFVATPIHAAVGRTSGSHSVSNNGSFSYSIPIFTPPGPRGIQPTVQLVYNSNGGTGILGRGWSLSGELASSIRYCPSTIAQDGYTHPYARICLDGNRLRKQSGAYYGDPGSVYQLEVADGSRITRSNDAYASSTYWTVERKNGLIYTYGGGGNSYVADSYEYRLREIRDRSGNKVRFTWKAADSTTSGTTHPVNIEWTQTSSGSGTYIHSMDFIYSAGGNSANSLRKNKRISGALEYDSDLLTAITISTSGTVKRKYVLTYDNSPTTAAKRLAQVTECSDSGATDCFAPTSISYQAGENGVEAVGTGFGGDGQYDFNGDGIKDLWNGSHVRFGSASGYGAWISAGVSAPQGIGRLNGTAADQIIGSSAGTLYVYSWNGSTFSATSTGLAASAFPSGFVVADVNGDDRDDLVYPTYASGMGYQPLNDFRVFLSVRHSTATAGSPSFASPVDVYHIWPVGYPYTMPPNWEETVPYWSNWDTMYSEVFPTLSKGGDANGDGREDLNVQLSWNWYFINSANPNEALGGGGFSSGGVADFGIYDTGLYIMDVADGTTLLAADFNGDNCDDYAVNGGVGLSNCAPMFYLAGIGSVVTDDSGLGSFAGFADWNSDGSDDYFIKDGSGAIYVRPFVGNAMGSAVYTGIVNASYDVRPTDGDGDGLDDISFFNNVHFHKSAAVFPDLVSEVADGFGVAYAPTYASSAGVVHTPGSGAALPNINFTGGLRLVSKVTASDGIGGTYDTDYHYYGAQGSVTGRGFLGFAEIESVDSRNGITHELQFEQSFPYTGMLKSEKLYQPSGSGGHLISSKTFSVGSTYLDTTTYNERVLRYTSTVVEDTYEVGGAANGNKITSSTTTTTYDGWGNVTASTKVVTDEDVSSPYYGNTWTTGVSNTFAPSTTYWCLGLPTNSSATSSTTVSAEPSVTRTRSFDPDYVNCRMNAEVVEPLSSTMLVSTSYGYDSFGNVSTVSVVGRNPDTTVMATRMTTINWGTTGQFPVSVTNPLSQSTTRTFHSTFGSLVSETDPNGIVVVNNEYDAFGRITRSIRADGTATRTTYAACSTYGCEKGDPGSGATSINKMIVVASERNTSDTEVRDSRIYLDQFDRPIVQKAMTLSGAYSRVGTQYDALGRVYRQTVPCDASSCTAYWITNTYDLLGRVSTQARPQSQSNSTPVTTTFTYAGRTQVIVDPESRNTTKVLDVNGWMRRSRDHDSYGQNFNYDAAGSLIGVTDTASNPLFSASYHYGAKPFQYSTTDMDLGTWSYTYNSLGELVSWQDANTRSFSQTYDALSRVTSRTDQNTGQNEGTTTWTYGTSAGNHNIGRLSGVSMTGYSESFSYDSVGRASTQTITTDQSYAIDYAYTNQGLLDTLTYPTSTSGARVKVKYGYAYGILQSATDWTSGSAGTVYWTANAQNVRGQTTQETLGNGVVTNRNFDAVTGWLNTIQSGVSGGTGLQNQSYAYDKVGNVTQRQENTLGLTENFYYDNLYRLDYSQLGGVTNLDLTYDAMGNITNRTDVNGNATWTYDGSRKHAVASTGSGGVTYSYDNNGNMTSRAGQTISWSSFNYPTYLATATENTTFYYGPNRQYYRQDYNGPSSSETTYYIGDLLEKVCPSTTCVSGTIDWRHYIVAEGQTVAIVSRKSSGTNVVNYPLEDNQGSSSVLTNSSGTNLARVSYNAFGLPRDGSDWDGAVPSGDLTTIEGMSRRGYTSHSMLGRMGLIHMNGRVQDAVTGRFLSPDPHVPNPGVTQMFNRYSYVNNNPLSFIDPSGFEPELDELIVDACIASMWGVRDIFGTLYCYPQCAPWQVHVVEGLGFCMDIPAPDNYVTVPTDESAGGGGGGGGGFSGRTQSLPQSLPQSQPQSQPQSLPQTRVPCRAGVDCYARELNFGSKCLRSANAGLFSNPAYRSQVNRMMDFSLRAGTQRVEYGFISDASTGQIGPLFTSGRSHALELPDMRGPNGELLPERKPLQRFSNPGWVATHAHPNGTPPSALSGGDLVFAYNYGLTIAAVDRAYNVDCSDGGM